MRGGEPAKARKTGLELSEYGRSVFVSVGLVRDESCGHSKELVTQSCLKTDSGLQGCKERETSARPTFGVNGAGAAVMSFQIDPARGWQALISPNFSLHDWTATGAEKY